MKETIQVIRDGATVDAEVVLCFEAEQTKKKYVIYTFNEVDETGNIALYSAVVDESSEPPTFNDIETEEEWAMVKDVMKQIVVDWKE